MLSFCKNIFMMFIQDNNGQDTYTMSSFGSHRS